MAEHPHVKRFRRVLETRRRAAIEEADAALLDGLFAPDVVWHGAAGSSGDTAHGKDDVIALWNGFAREGGPLVEVMEVYADGLHTVATLAFSGDGGQSVDQAVVFHLDPDGTVTEFWSMPTDRAIADAFARRGPVPEHRNLPVFRAAENTRERNTFEPEDIENIHAFLREDVQWHGAGDSQWAEGVKGRENVIGLFKMFKQATGGTMHLAMHGMFADDTHAVSLAELTATRADNPSKTMDMKEVNLFHLDEAGKAHEFWGISEDTAIMDGFWAP